MKDLSRLKTITFTKNNEKIDYIANVNGFYDKGKFVWQSWVHFISGEGGVNNSVEPSHSLDEALIKLTTFVNDNGIQTQIVLGEEIVEDELDIEGLLAEIRSLTLDQNENWSIMIGWYDVFDWGTPSWRVDIPTNNRWSRPGVAQATGEYLFDACAKLLKKLNQMKDELPYIW